LPVNSADIDAAARGLRHSPCERRCFAPGSVANRGNQGLFSKAGRCVAADGSFQVFAVAFQQLSSIRKAPPRRAALVAFSSAPAGRGGRRRKILNDAVDHRDAILTRPSPNANAPSLMALKSVLYDREPWDRRGIPAGAHCQ